MLFETILLMVADVYLFRMCSTMSSIQSTPQLVSLFHCLDRFLRLPHFLLQCFVQVNSSLCFIKTSISNGCLAIVPARLALSSPVAAFFFGHRQLRF
jgi:hypothetical protein